MKAITLEQVVQNFVPNEPLSGQDLRFWFVDRPRSPRGRLKRYLQSEHSRDVKVLLVGHRGSGKSTELNKLAEEIHEQFEVVPFNVLELTGRTGPQVIGEYETVGVTRSRTFLVDTRACGCEL